MWRHRHTSTRPNTATNSTVVSAIPSTVASDTSLTGNAAIETVNISEKEQANMNPVSKPKSGWRWGRKLTPKVDQLQVSDPEKDGPAKKGPRPMCLYAPFYCGLAVALSICRDLSPRVFSRLIFSSFSLHRKRSFRVSLRVGFRSQLCSVCSTCQHSISTLRRTGGSLLLTWKCYTEWRIVLRAPTRWKYLLGVCHHRCSSLFFANTIFRIGPVAQYYENSRYYSAIRPEPNKEVDAALPHITIELPVYKESLTETMYV